MDGIIVVDKKIGETSFDVVREIRKKYNTKKVGHTGTLDPMATGVLPVLLGEATKLSDYLMDHDKEYIATLKLGEKRSTGDSEGEVVEEKSVPKLNEENIKDVLNSFIGKSKQVPPMYSAIKVNGQKLYDLARKGQVVERQARSIEICEIELLETEKPDEISFRVCCSKGTYIRTLCEDIAEKLGTVGYMKSLRRIRVGKFLLKDANKIFSIEEVLADKPQYILKENELGKLLNGVKIYANLPDNLVRVYDKDKFIGIAVAEKNTLKRKIIIN